MMSNTATPYYYGIFRDKVLAGEIPVCKEIEMQMNRIDARIRNPNYYYDEDAIKGWVAFCDNELTLTDGSDMELLDSFKLWGEDALSWFYIVERSVYVPGEKGGQFVRKLYRKRLTTKQFIITARGSAKSMYDMAIHAYFLTVDGSTTKQLTTAPTQRQAEEVLQPFRTAIIRHRGPLFDMLTQGSINNTTGNRANRPMLVSTKNGIENFLSGSLLEVRTMSINKLQGFRHKIATVDEWLSGDVREDVIGAIEQGSSKAQSGDGSEDYLIIATSSEGTVRNDVGDQIKMEVLSILRNEYINDHVSIWYYRLDDIKEVAYPELWIKANPNLGKTVSYEVYQQEVEKAEKVPSQRNDILAKRFGIPMEGYTYFFTYEETIPFPPQSFYGMRCAMGMDASQGDDFWSFGFLFPLRNGRFGYRTMNYISERTAMQLPNAINLKYQEFFNEGSLRVLPGAMLDPMDVYDDIYRFIEENRYEICAFGYDPYNAEGFVDRWGMENGPFGIEKVRQGSRTESVPLGEIKHLCETRMLIFDQKIVQFTMGNAITIEDTNGNRKLYKKRADNKIDCVASMIDCLVAYKIHKDAFE